MWRSLIPDPQSVSSTEMLDRFYETLLLGVYSKNDLWKLSLVLFGKDSPPFSNTLSLVFEETH